MRRLIIICFFSLFNQVLFVSAQDSKSVSPTLNQGVARRLSWTLGSKLGFTAINYAGGADESKINDMLNEVRPVAATLGVQIPAFPKRSGSNIKDRSLMKDYLVATAGLSIGKDLTERYSEDISALFITSIACYVLLEDYEPYWPTETPGTGDSALRQAAIIERGAAEAKLPESLWKPLINLVAERRASKQEVWYAVRDLQKNVEGYLEKLP